MPGTSAGAKKPALLPAGEPLLQQAARAALWNAVLLPVVSLFNLAFAVVIRRKFGLFSGVYDVLIGLLNALLVYSSLGVPTSLAKFLPEVATLSGGAEVRRFLRLTATIRLGCLAALLVPLNIFAAPVAERLGLGAEGRLYFGLLSALAMVRAVSNFTSQTLNAFFAQQWSNSFALAQVVLDIAFVGLALLLGFEMAGVLGGVVASATVVAIWSLRRTQQVVRRLDVGQSEDEQEHDREWWKSLAGRFYRFSAFSYLLGFVGILTDIGFAAPALALVLEAEGVALFSTAFKLTFMTVVLVVSGFRGLYQPVFARLRLRNDAGQLQHAFVSVSKAQLVGLLPAGIGLMVLSGDYIPLLFGAEFQPAVPIAWILIAFMYAETALNLPNIILSVDEQYRALLWTQAVAVVAAPLFVITARSTGLVGAAVVLGGARLATALLGYAICRRTYGVRFPWRFGFKVGAVGLAMAAAIGAARTKWPTSPIEAVTLTVLGMLVYLVGLKLARVLGPDEIDLLRRSRIPGHKWAIAWLAASRNEDASY